MCLRLRRQWCVMWCAMCNLRHRLAVLLDLRCFRVAQGIVQAHEHGCGVRYVRRIMRKPLSDSAP